MYEYLAEITSILILSYLVVNGEASGWLPIDSGVLQGSVLGGPFFDVFIDDIDFAALLAFLRKFADDTKLAMAIRSKEDADRFQREVIPLQDKAVTRPAVYVAR